MNSQKLNELFKEIKVKRGKLTPEIVVYEAEEKSHPLHGHFEWDDSEAAHRYRCDQAAELIRSVHIEATLDSGPVYLRQWHAVRAAGVVDAPEGYVPNDEVLNEPTYRAALLRQMERDWKAIQQRYEAYKEFWSMVNRSRRRKVAKPAKRSRAKAGAR